MSSCWEGAVDLAADVALETPTDHFGGFAFSQSPFDLVPGGFVGAHPGEHDGVNRPVEPSVAGAVEAVTFGVS